MRIDRSVLYYRFTLRPQRVQHKIIHKVKKCKNECLIYERRAPVSADKDLISLTHSAIKPANSSESGPPPPPPLWGAQRIIVSSLYKRVISVSDCAIARDAAMPWWRLPSFLTLTVIRHVTQRLHRRRLGGTIKVKRKIATWRSYKNEILMLCAGRAARTPTCALEWLRFEEKKKKRSVWEIDASSTLQDLRLLLRQETGANSDQRDVPHLRSHVTHIVKLGDSHRSARVGRNM